MKIVKLIAVGFLLCLGVATVCVTLQTDDAIKTDAVKYGVPAAHGIQSHQAQKEF